MEKIIKKELDRSLNKFQSAICRIQEALNFTDQDILTLAQSKKMQLQSLSLNVHELDALAKNLNLLPETIFNNTFCTETLKAHYRGDKKFIRKDWLLGEGCRITCLNNALSLASEDVQQRVLSKFQLTRQSLEDGQRRIGIHLLGLVVEEISNQMMNPFLAYELGELSCRDFIKTRVSQELSLIQDPKEAYKSFIKDAINKIECNMEYSIEEDFGNSIVISYKPQKNSRKLLQSLPDQGAWYDLVIRGFFEELHLFWTQEKVRIRNFKKVCSSKTTFFEVLLD